MTAKDRTRHAIDAAQQDGRLAADAAAVLRKRLDGLPKAPKAFQQAFKKHTSKLDGATALLDLAADALLEIPDPEQAAVLFSAARKAEGAVSSAARIERCLPFARARALEPTTLGSVLKGLDAEPTTARAAVGLVVAFLLAGGEPWPKLGAALDAVLKRSKVTAKQRADARRSWVDAALASPHADRTKLDVWLGCAPELVARCRDDAKAQARLLALLPCSANEVDTQIAVLEDAGALTALADGALPTSAAAWIDAAFVRLRLIGADVCVPILLERLADALAGHELRLVIPSKYGDIYDVDVLATAFRLGLRVASPDPNATMPLLGNLRRRLRGHRGDDATRVVEHPEFGPILARSYDQNLRDGLSGSQLAHASGDWPGLSELWKRWIADKAAAVRSGEANVPALIDEVHGLLTIELIAVAPTVFGELVDAIEATGAPVGPWREAMNTPPRN